MKSDKSKSDEIIGERKIRVETDDVPIYRSYGVTKKVNPKMRAVRDFFAKAITVIFLAIELALILVGTVMLAVYTDVLVATTVFVVLFSLFFFNATKLIRRRASFWRKLKKTCNEKKYRLNIERGFFKSLSWAEGNEVDFTLKAGKYTYYVKIATSRRYLAGYTFVSKDEMKYTKIARRNIFTTILDFKNKTRSMPINFPKGIDDNDKYTVRAILINPAVMNIEKKGNDGVVIPTGSGEKLFGYTIYTANGFIESIKRNAEEQK